jgi:hypothetical protein
MADTTQLDILGTDPEVLGLQRQRQLANLLTGQAFNQPQGQVISGHYVKPSALQQALPMINAGIGALTNANLDTKQTELAAALRGQKAEAYTKFQTLMSNPATRGEAMNYAASNQYLQPLAAELMKGMKLGEGEKFVMPNLGGGAPVELATGGAKYHAPIQIDTGTAIEIRDPLDPTKVLQRLPKSQMPTAGQVLETENGPMLVNTRTAQAQPIMAGGQALVGGKPLTESQGNATAFGMRMKESNQLINDLEKKGVTNTGVIRSTIGGIAGMTPFIGEKLQQGVQSGMNVFPSALGGPSAEQQQVDAARKNFITAVLRKESGAAISPSEFYNESQKYFPQPGDSDAVIAQKRHARDTAIKAMEIQAGPGKRQIEQTNLPIENNGWSVKAVK